MYEKLQIFVSPLPFARGRVGDEVVFYAKCERVR